MKKLCPTWLLLATLPVLSHCGCSQSTPVTNSSSPESTRSEPMQAIGKPSDDRPEPLGRGAASPSLSVAGWINGPAPSSLAVPGKVVVVDVWAHW